MPRKLCILHGNCQGDVLAILLRQSEEFSRHFEIRRIVNYLRESPSPEELSRCSLFLYQRLGRQWGANATDNLLGLLPYGCESICFPNMFFMGYWPFWYRAESVIEFPDSFLESLLARNLPIPALLKLYWKCDPALTGDISQIPSSTIAREREKERYSNIKYVSLIEENWRKKQIFLTINHPSMSLLTYVANSVLELLGLPPLKKEVTDNIPHPYDEFWLPIHPGVGKQLSLPFADASRKYNCFSQKLTHAEYTNVYLACRQNSIYDISTALANIHLKQSENNEKN